MTRPGSHNGCDDGNKGMHGRNYYVCVCVCVFVFVFGTNWKFNCKKEWWMELLWLFFCNKRPWFDESSSQVSASLGFCTSFGLVDKLIVNPKVRWVLNGYLFPTSPLLLGYDTCDWCTMVSTIHTEAVTAFLINFGAYMNTSFIIIMKVLVLVT